MSKNQGKKKPYTAPSFARLDAEAAKLLLETKADPGDMSAKAMLKSIRTSKATRKLKFGDRKNPEGEPES